MQYPDKLKQFCTVRTRTKQLLAAAPGLPEQAPGPAAVLGQPTASTYHRDAKAGTGRFTVSLAWEVKKLCSLKWKIL